MCTSTKCVYIYVHLYMYISIYTGTLRSGVLLSEPAWAALPSGAEDLLGVFPAPGPACRKPSGNLKKVPGPPVPEGPSTQYLRFPVPKTILLMVFGPRVLKYWVLGPPGICSSFLGLVMDFVRFSGTESPKRALRGGSGRGCSASSSQGT